MAPPAGDPALYRPLQGYVRNARPEYEEILRTLVEIPSVSMDPGRGEDIRRCAEVAADHLRICGARATVVRTRGNPVVLGMLRNGREYPTVLLYHHLDVQPADPAEWRRDPFTLHRSARGWSGRGTTDDKGPAVTALLAARYAAEHGLPLNIGFLCDLEEEIGSPSLAGFVQRRGRSLRADSVLVSDTSWIARGHPTVVYGLRGLLGMRISLQTHERDLHSGSAGGVARNPLMDMSRVLAGCQDPRTGRVTIPGFTDGVQPLTGAEMEGFLGSGFTVEEFRRVHGITRIRPGLRSRAAVIRALMAEPTFEVHGISGGYAGPGIKTIIPHRAEALVSMRLVPHQDPAAVARRVKEYLVRKNPDLQVTVEERLEPFLGEFSGPYADAALEAMRYGFGKEPVFWREGGSIGAVVTLRRYLQVPVSLLGLSLPSDRYHGPDEQFEWRQAHGGIRMLVRYFDALTSIPREGVSAGKAVRRHPGTRKKPARTVIPAGEE
ncbi:MAG: M20/M25/M40 family metallo-hydrolase [Methanomicrobiales archaeon]|nr:M20/M25/M40 family metallo-hydrolase [Methanomicrobiales archaeon]